MLLDWTSATLQAIEVPIKGGFGGTHSIIELLSMRRRQGRELHFLGSRMGMGAGKEQEQMREMV